MNTSRQSVFSATHVVVSAASHIGNMITLPLRALFRNTASSRHRLGQWEIGASALARAVANRSAAEMLHKVVE